jgi:predicted nucleotidyltransferase
MKKELAQAEATWSYSRRMVAIYAGWWRVSFMRNIAILRCCYDVIVSSGCKEFCVKTKEEVLRILQQEKPELARLYGVKRLALFGSYARERQREESDVDILVEVDPSIGLGFVELAERIEEALGVRAEVVSRRAIKPRYWEEIKKDLVDVT